MDFVPLVPYLIHLTSTRLNVKCNLPLVLLIKSFSRLLHAFTKSSENSLLSKISTFLKTLDENFQEKEYACVFRTKKYFHGQTLQLLNPLFTIIWED